ncbi:MAG: hypothetical protein QM681_14370, partial [Novosphingobium sp.]
MSTSTMTTDVQDETFVRKALDMASMNVLRMALYQLTGDAELAAIPTVESPIRGGALIAYTVPDEYRETIKRKALDWLDGDRRADHRCSPTREEAADLMAMFAGYPLSPDEARFGYEELALEDFPRDVQWAGGTPPP